MVSTMKMLTTTRFTLSQRISLLFTRLFLQFHHISPLLLDLVTFTVSTSQEMLSFTPSFSPSTRSMSRMPLEQRKTSPSSQYSMADLARRSRSTQTPFHTVLLRSTSIPIFSTLISLVSETTFSRRKTTLCSKSATQMERISQTRSTLIPGFGYEKERRPCPPVLPKVSKISTQLANCNCQFLNEEHSWQSGQVASWPHFSVVQRMTKVFYMPYRTFCNSLDSRSMKILIGMSLATIREIDQQLC